MKPLLTLADLEGLPHDKLLHFIESDYEVEASQLEGIQILIAYQSTGSWGCDSSSFFLFQKEGKLFEVHGSHCSCYGFEGQWKPEESSIAYLKSKQFGFSCGGYDDESDSNLQKVKDYISSL